jgi:hypothetical protein
MTSDKKVTDEKARAILERAAEIDRRAGEVMSIETLRQAAREAGIAESSFAAALSEHEQGTSREATTHSRRQTVVRAFAGIGGAMILLLGIAIISRLFP